MQETAVVARPPEAARGFKRNATMQGPRPDWGKPLVVADGPHLASYDEGTRAWFRKTGAAKAVGLVAALGGLVVRLDVLFLLGAMAWLVAFRVEGVRGYQTVRLWGIYENGLVGSSLNPRTRASAFIGWEKARRVQVRRYHGAPARGLESPGQWVIWGEGDRGKPTRIRENDLVHLFGYTNAETQALLEASIVALRSRVGPEKLGFEERESR